MNNPTCRFDEYKLIACDRLEATMYEFDMENLSNNKRGYARQRLRGMDNKVYDGVARLDEDGAPRATIVTECPFCSGNLIHSSRKLGQQCCREGER